MNGCIASFCSMINDPGKAKEILSCIPASITPSPAAQKNTLACFQEWCKHGAGISCTDEDDCAKRVPNTLPCPKSCKTIKMIPYACAFAECTHDYDPTAQIKYCSWWFDTFPKECPKDNQGFFCGPDEQSKGYTPVMGGTLFHELLHLCGKCKELPKDQQKHRKEFNNAGACIAKKAGCPLQGIGGIRIF